MVSKHRQIAMRRIHESVVDLIAFMNMPHLDDLLLAEAGVTIDRALFPLLIGIERFGLKLEAANACHSVSGERLITALDPLTGAHP
jgi:hypothetical protein